MDKKLLFIPGFLVIVVILYVVMVVMPQQNAEGEYENSQETEQLIQKARTSLNPHLCDQLERKDACVDAVLLNAVTKEDCAKLPDEYAARCTEHLEGIKWEKIGESSVKFVSGYNQQEHVANTDFEPGIFNPKSVVVWGIDSDGDNLYDHIAVDLEMDISREARYYYILRIGGGRFEDTKFINESFDEGTHKLRWIFDTQVYWVDSLEGPFDYTVSDVFQPGATRELRLAIRDERLGIAYDWWYDFYRFTMPQNVERATRE